MIPALLSFLAGMILGYRFKVTVLIVAVLAILALTLVLHLVLRNGFWWSVVTAYINSAALQIGYVLGLVWRYKATDDGPHNRGRSGIRQSVLANYETHCWVFDRRSN